MYKAIEIEVAGFPLKIEVQKWAKQSNGSAVVSYKDNIILATANMKEEVKEFQDFLPLMVDFRENTYAAGKIPGGFFKREGKPSEKEVLLSRLIDRPIRPLFPDGFFNETQIIAMLLSADFSIDYDSLGIIAASAALLSSTIPFTTPVAAVKIGRKNGEYVINPGLENNRDPELSVLAAGTKNEIVMLEAAGNQFPEEYFLEALQIAKNEIRKICEAQEALINPEKVAVSQLKELQEAENCLQEKIAAALKDAIFTAERTVRREKLARIEEEVLQNIEDEKQQVLYKQALHSLEGKIFRQTLLKERRRTDGRDFDQIRPISIELGILPRAHGSAIFTRGETQALATVTLGSEDDAQRLDNLDSEIDSKRFMLHYNFPPFSVGEVSFLRGAGRREIGHGNLAEKALQAVIPSEEEFSYTIRVVSDILESNGSSSMATVCGGTLALMHAGVPIKAPVAGIAMGLVKEENDFVILTDIAGYEDHFGDMDFKIAGTEKGITAIQLDIKIGGLSDEIIKETVERAKAARLFILDKIRQVIDRPSEKLSPYAPLILTINISPDKIKDLIGPGGKIIKDLVATYNVKINVDPDGKVKVVAASQELGQKVIERIMEITCVPEVNKIYQGKVTRIEDYGAFVEILPGTVGLLHISEVSYRRIKDIRREFRLGQIIRVKVLELDGDRIKLTRRGLEEENAV